MRHLYTLIATILILFPSLDLVAQNTCAAPQNIASLPYASPAGVLNKHTTCNKVDDYRSDDACGNTYINAEDFVYRYTAGAGVTCINLALSGTINIGGASQPGLFVFDGCPDVTSTNCIAQGINTTTGSGTKTVNLTNVRVRPGTTYYFVVAADTGCYSFTLNVTQGSCPAPADTVGSGCMNAKVVPSLPYKTTAGYAFTTCGKGRTYNIGNPCESYYMDGESYTFKYTSPVDQCATIKVTTSVTDASLWVYENCPTSGKGICMAGTTGSWSGSMSTFVSFEAGKDYYFVVSSYNAFAPCQNFDIDIKPILITGRVCADAIDLPTVPYYLASQTTRCKDND